MYINTYGKALPDTTDENLRSIIMVQVSAQTNITTSVSSDVVKWYVKLYEFEESQILIRIYDEYIKMER
jgi:hypothetical protein